MKATSFVICEKSFFYHNNLIHVEFKHSLPIYEYCVESFDLKIMIYDAIRMTLNERYVVLK